MKNEMKTANNFSRNLDERTSDLMLDVYNEIKMSDKLFSQQEHNAQLEEEARKAKEAADAEKKRKEALEQAQQGLSKTSIKTSDLNVNVNKSKTNTVKANSTNFNKKKISDTERGSRRR